MKNASLEEEIEILDITGIRTPPPPVIQTLGGRYIDCVTEALDETNYT
jgi:hypothetical protein